MADGSMIELAASIVAGIFALATLYMKTKLDGSVKEGEQAKEETKTSNDQGDLAFNMATYLMSVVADNSSDPTAMDGPKQVLKKMREMWDDPEASTEKMEGFALAVVQSYEERAKIEKMVNEYKEKFETLAKTISGDQVKTAEEPKASA